MHAATLALGALLTSTLLATGCGGGREPVAEDPRNATIPLAGEHQATPPPAGFIDAPLATLPAGGGPRMSDGEAAQDDDVGGPAAAPVPDAPLPGGPAQRMSFFVSSEGTGDKGGDLGGLAGADAICQRLATAAGRGTRTWHAYLSTSKENARDRIGKGPWLNAAGKQVSVSPAELVRSGVGVRYALDELGRRIDFKNAHDIFTGSKPDGTFGGASCKDWTSSSPADRALVGHADAKDPMNQWDHWSSTHETHGCDREGMQSTAARGHLYCFAQ